MLLSSQTNRVQPSNSSSKMDPDEASANGYVAVNRTASGLPHEAAVAEIHPVLLFLKWCLPTRPSKVTEATPASLLRVLGCR